MRLTYSDSWGVNAGKTITVSRKEYDDDRHRLMSESGNVTRVRFLPESETRLNDLLRFEYSKRMMMPVGDTGGLIQRVRAKLAEVRQGAQTREAHETAEPPTEKPRQTLAAKLRSAGEKAQAQGAHSGVKAPKREERE